MAEEVEISNVGGEGGVASEATLASLTRAIEKLAASTGKDPKKEAAKVQKAHNDAVKNGITVSSKYRDALDKKTEATDKATKATNRYSKAIIGSIAGLLGSVTQSALGLGKALFDGSDRLTDFAEHIPLVGSYLTTFTEILDNTFDVFRNISSSGASFNNSMVDLMRASAAARMSIDDFGALVGRNSEQLATFGGTVTRGAQTIGRLQQGLGSMRNDLLNMGFTFEEINEGLINFQFLNRAGSRAQFQSQQQLALAAGEYLMHLGELSKLTGKSVDQLQGEMNQRQTNAAFQMRLARMDPEQRARIQEGLATALATGGEAAADRFMQMVLGMGPLTEETALLAATMPEVEQALRRLYDSAINAADAQQFQADQVDAMVDMIAGAGESGQRLETVLAAAGAGLGGTAGAIADILNSMGKSFTDYMDEQGNIDRAAIRRDILEAQAEQRRRDALTRSMAAFNERITEARRTIQEQFITSGIYTHAADLVDHFSSILSSPDMMNAIHSVIDILIDFSNVLVETVRNISNFGFDTAIFGGTETIDTPAGPQQVQIEGLFSELFGEGGIISSAFSAVAPQLTEMAINVFGGVFNVLGEGITNWFSNNWDTILVGALAGIGAIIAAPVIGVFGGIAAGIAAVIGWEKLKDIVEGIWNTITGFFSGITDWWNNFSFTDILSGVRDSITGFFSGITDWWNNFSFSSILPDWMRPKELSPEEISESENLWANTNEFAGVQGYNTGTKGFEDFGNGTLAMLHGKEAVIPLDSPLGQLISNINTSAAIGRSNTAQLPNLNSNTRTATQTTPKVEIENISTLIENLNDIKNQLINTMNTANQGSLESIKQLNMLMSQMLAVLQDMAEDADQIERNTRSTGSNIANGRVSAVR